MSNEPTREPITMTYAGRRLGKGNKLVQAVEFEGRSLTYGKLPHGVVGGLYNVEATRSDDGGLTIYVGTWQYTGEKRRDAQVAAWEALDRDAYATTRRLSAERKAQRSSELDLALEHLTAIVQKAATRHEADAIIRVVTDRLSQSWWNRP